MSYGNTYDWRISPMVQPDKGAERKADQRETPIALLDGAAGG